MDKSKESNSDARAGQLMPEKESESTPVEPVIFISFYSGGAREQLNVREPDQALVERLGVLIKQLSHDEKEIRIAAVDELVKVGQHAVSVLLIGLRDPHWMTRANSAYALGKITPKDPLAVTGLVEALRDPEAKVRQYAARSLEEMATFDGIDYAHPTAVPALIDALRDPETGVRRRVATALATIAYGYPQVVTGLVKGLRDQKNGVRQHAASIMLNIYAYNSAAVEAFIEALHDEDAEIRAAACLGLRGIDGSSNPLAVVELVKALRDPEADVRQHAAGTLLRIANTDRAVAVFSEAIRDPEVGVRVIAVDALAELATSTMDGHGHRVPSNPEAVAALVEALLDSEAVVRQQASLGLRYIYPSDPMAVAALVKALRDPESEVCYDAAGTLLRIAFADPLVVTEFVEALSDPVAHVRLNSAYYLGRIGHCSPMVPAALVKALNDNDVSVRGKAAWALGNIRVATEQVRSGLLSLLADNAPEVRRDAVEALGKITAGADIRAEETAAERKSVREQMSLALRHSRKHDPSEVVRLQADLELAGLQTNDGVGTPVLVDTPANEWPTLSPAVLFEHSPQIYMVYLIRQILRRNGRADQCLRSEDIMQELTKLGLPEQHPKTVRNGIAEVQKMFQKHFNSTKKSNREFKLFESIHSRGYSIVTARNYWNEDIDKAWDMIKQIGIMMDRGAGRSGKVDNW